MMKEKDVLAQSIYNEKQIETEKEIRVLMSKIEEIKKVNLAKNYEGASKDENKQIQSLKNEIEMQKKQIARMNIQKKEIEGSNNHYEIVREILVQKIELETLIENENKEKEEFLEQLIVFQEKYSALKKANK